MNYKSSAKNGFTFLLVVLFLSTNQFVFAQQESQYTQFMYNKLFYNPAYAGVRDMPSISAIYRRQWIGFDGAPESQLLNFDTPLVGKKVGLGISVSAHKLGIQRIWNVNMAYSYNLQINANQAIRFGMQGTFRHLSLNFSDPGIIIRHANDQSIVEGIDSGRAYGNFGFGIYYEYKNFHLGISAPHFFQNEVTFNTDVNLTRIAKEARHYYVMTGVNIQVKEQLMLQPGLLFKYVKNAPADVDINVRLTYDHLFTVGITYRTGGDGSGESIDLLTLYQFKQMALGISYDFNLSELGKETSGSFEIIARYDLAKTDAFLSNPRFFN